MIGIQDIQNSSAWFDPILSFFTNTLRVTGSDTARGLFATEGDRLLRADRLRELRGVTGADVKIGVLSTGGEGIEQAQRTGDLPTLPGKLIVNDRYGHAGGRGTSMLEVIHDVAPGAAVSFATAPSKQAVLDGLIWLVEVQGVDIVVSDVVDYSEPFFEVGPVAAAIKALLDAHPNLLFVQAAGNDGQAHSQAQLKPIDFSKPELSSEPRKLHQFGGTTQQPIVTLSATLPPNSSNRLVLQWSDPFSAAEHQLQLLVLDPELHPIGPDNEGDVRVFRSSPIPKYQTPFPTSEAVGLAGGGLLADASLAGHPLDTLTLMNRSSTSRVVKLAVELISDRLPPPSEAVQFELFGLGGIHFSQNSGNALVGSAAIEDALVVGAVSASDISQPTPYSSSGPSLLLDPRDRSAHEHPTLDVMGVAGVQVSGFGTGRQLFDGTSAAAAHVAGIAALLKQLKPGASSRELREAIQGSAANLGAAGYDNATGFGRIDAFAAAARWCRVGRPIQAELQKATHPRTNCIRSSPPYPRSNSMLCLRMMTSAARCWAVERFRWCG